MLDWHQHHRFPTSMAIFFAFFGAFVGSITSTAMILWRGDKVYPDTMSKGTGSLWSSNRALPPQVWNFRDRLFVGAAAYDVSANRSQDAMTWLPRAESGPSWMPRDSQFSTMATHGNIAVSGLSRASDGTGVNSPSAIGLAGYAIADYDQHPAWGGYLECQLEKGIRRQCFGLEIDVKNKGPNSIGSPYGMGTGGHALWLAAGGDRTYGGAAAHPSTSAISVVKNSSTWNTGIIFSKDAITGCDGLGSVCAAAKFAIGQQTCWYVSAAIFGCVGGVKAGDSVVFAIPIGHHPTANEKPCFAGSMTMDDMYFYACTGSGIWRRAKLLDF